MQENEISAYVLTNADGMQIKLLNYGAALASVKVPTQNGQLVELTLGFDMPAEYLTHPFYFGCTVGRVANRIAHGKFTYQDKTFQLAKNEKNACHLHGGDFGFDKVLWDARVFSDGVEFSYLSAAGEEGYPGNLQVKVTYTLTAQNELKITYNATTDAPTAVNLTNHSYWNLAGAGSGDVLDHTLEIFSDQYLETTPEHLPTGKVLDVTKTPFDFRKPRTIGERLQEVQGYDHCYVLKNSPIAVRACDPKSQRRLEVSTTQPGVQFYSGNYLRDYAIAGGKSTRQWGGFCLEAQGFPDAVNHPAFPSVILLPEQEYSHEITYKLYFF